MRKGGKLPWMRVALGLAILLLSATVAAAQAPAPAPPPETEPFIIGGVPAPLGAWRSAVALDLEGAGGTHYLCGGTLLDERWVLTAAHCAAILAGPADALVGVGSQDLGAMAWRAVDTVTLHPGYDSDTFDNDVALLRLAAPVAGIPAAPILPETLGFRADGAAATLVGWGDTVGGGAGALASHLRQVGVNTLGNAACNASYTSLGVPNPITAGMVCAGMPPLRGACSGDSGGPMFVRVNGVTLQAGVVSWGVVGCRTAGGYSVQARVSHYQAWLEAQVGHGLAPAATFDLPILPAWTDQWTLTLEQSGVVQADCSGSRLAGTASCSGPAGATVPQPNRIRLPAGRYDAAFTLLDANGDAWASAASQPTLLPGHNPRALALPPAPDPLVRIGAPRTPYPAARVVFSAASGAPLGACTIDFQAAGADCLPPGVAIAPVVAGGPAIPCFGDLDGNGLLGLGEPAYLAAGAAVAAGDLRIAYPPTGGKGSLVAGTDADLGRPCAPAAGGLAFRDQGGDGQLGPGDTLHLDTDGSLTATAGDLVLSGAAAGTVVTAATASNAILAPDAGTLAFLDFDGDGLFTRGDTLFDDGAAGGSDVLLGSPRFGGIVADAALPADAAVPMAFPHLAPPAGTAAITVTGLDLDGADASRPWSRTLSLAPGRALRLVPVPVPDGAALRLAASNAPASYTLAVAGATCTVTAGVPDCAGAQELAGTAILLPVAQPTLATLVVDAPGPAADPVPRTLSLAPGRTLIVPVLFP